MATPPEGPSAPPVPASTAGANVAADPKRRDCSKPPFGVGRFQLGIVVSTALAAGILTLHLQSLKVAYVGDHWCERPARFANLSVAEWKRMAIPLDKNGEHSHCTVRDPPDDGPTAKIVPCKSWEFEPGEYGISIVNQWLLVCDRSWLLVLAQIVWSTACILLVPVLCTVADHIGRRTVAFITVPVILITGVANSLPSDFQFFVGTRAAVLIATTTLLAPLMALAYEVSPVEMLPEYCVVVSLASFVIGPPTMFVASLIKGGWAVIQLVVMVPTCLLVVVYYTVLESPDWLLATGNVEDAERVALSAARLNGVSPDTCRALLAQVVDNFAGPGRSGLCSAGFRARTALLAYSWVVISYSYDAYVDRDEVPVNGTCAVLSFALSALGCIAAVPCLDRFGFKRVTVCSGLVFSASSAAMAASYEDEETLLRCFLLVLMRMAGSVSFMCLVTLTAQSYPIIAHGRALGFALACNRLGDAINQISPFFLGTPAVRNKLAFTAVQLALFTAAVQCLPPETHWCTANRG
ncbi:beta-alanine transporter-like [Haemaphysalis longicornis]